MKVKIIHTINYWGIRVAIAIVIMVLSFLAYFFYNSSVIILGYQIDNPLFLYSKELEWWLLFIIYLTIVSFLNSIAFIILSFIFIKRRDDIEKVEKEYEIQFSRKLIEYIYSDFLTIDKSKDHFVDELKASLLKNKLAQEVLFSLIIRFQDLTTDNLSIKLSTLIEKAGLNKKFKYFLYSYNKSEQILAVKIISYLKVDEHKKAIAKYMNTTMKGGETIKFNNYEKDIAKYMNSNNITLRSEATIAQIRMSGAKNLDLLLSQRKHISRLGINSIVNAIEKTENTDIDLSKIINSPNPRIAAIGILLAKTQDRIEYKDLIKSILLRNKVLLREITWETFVYFADTEDDLEFMLNSFKAETHQNKLSIIYSLKKFAFNSKLVDFLDEVINTEEIEMKVTALRLLFDFNFSILYSYKKSTNKIVVESYKEVTDLIIV